MTRIRNAEAFLVYRMQALLRPLYCAIYLSLRSMWSLRQQSRIVVSRRGFLKSVSIATHLSSWALLPSYPLYRKSLHTPPSLPNRCLWTTLVWTQSRPILATPITPVARGDQTDMGMFPVCPVFTVCFSLLYSSKRHSHRNKNLFLPDHMLYPTPWLFLWYFFYWSPVNKHFVVVFVFRLNGPHVGCSEMMRWENQREIETDRACGLGSSQLSGSNLF